MTRDFCVVLVYSKEQTSIWPSMARSDSDNGRTETAGFFFSSNNSNLRGCAGVAATGGTRRAHNCIPVKDIVLLADSNYITGAQYSVLSLVTTSCVKIGYYVNTSVKNQRTSGLSCAESKCADTGTNDSGILQRSLRSVEPVCFPASHRALLHMKPRGSLAATVLTKGKTLPEGSADFEKLHQANRRSIWPSGREVLFQ